MHKHACKSRNNTKNKYFSTNISHYNLYAKNKNMSTFTAAITLGRLHNRGLLSRRSQRNFDLKIALLWCLRTIWMYFTKNMKTHPRLKKALSYTSPIILREVDTDEEVLILYEIIYIFTPFFWQITLC